MRGPRSTRMRGRPSPSLVGGHCIALLNELPCFIVFCRILGVQTSGEAPSSPSLAAGCSAHIRIQPQTPRANTMQFHLGRLIDHVHLRVSDLQASKRFYLAVMESLGRTDSLVEGKGFFHIDELFVDKADGPVSRIHLAFQAPDRDTVARFHQAALGAGGRENGPPGERSYHPGYYGAFVLDPDGNNIEAVFHGEATRSADSVVVTPVER